MEKKLRFISCGKFDKKYWLIILIVIILLGASIGLFYLFKKYLASNDLKMKVACNCISIAFFDNFCKTLMFIPGLISKKMNSSNNNNNLTIKQREKNNKVVEYIFNQKTITFSKKEKIYLILLMILDLVSNLGDYYSQIYFDDDADDLLLLDYFFYTQIFFLFILSKYLLKNDFYKSHIAIIKVINGEDSLIFLLSFIEFPKCKPGLSFLSCIKSRSVTKSTERACTLSRFAMNATISSLRNSFCCFRGSIDFSSKASN